MPWSQVYNFPLSCEAKCVGVLFQWKSRFVVLLINRWATLYYLALYFIIQWIWDKSSLPANDDMLTLLLQTKQIIYCQFYQICFLCLEKKKAIVTCGILTVPFLFKLKRWCAEKNVKIFLRDSEKQFYFFMKKMWRKPFFLNRYDTEQKMRNARIHFRKRHPHFMLYTERLHFHYRFYLSLTFNCDC